MQEARPNHDDEAVKRLVNEYDDALERYIPVLMQQAKIYWDMENYQQVSSDCLRSPNRCSMRCHCVWIYVYTTVVIVYGLMRAQLLSLCMD